MMAYTPKPWVNKLWLSWFVLHVAVILLVDAVPFYPKWLYLPPDSPLHFLERIHQFYLVEYNDPIVQWDPAAGGSPHMAWTRLFAYVEMLLQLPVAAYGVYRLGLAAPGLVLSGRDELLFLVYAFETAFTTLVCVHSILYWDPAVYSPAQKNVFIFQLYGPFLVAMSAMFFDMYLRLHSRLGAVDLGKKRR